MPKTPPNARWRDALRGTSDKGPKFANYSGWRVGQLLEAIDGVLEREKPEIAMIMIGTNDISGDRVPDTYAAQLAQVVDRCTAAHCVPLLSTIPPRRGHAKSVSQVNQIIRDVAASKKVPLVDFHAECLKRCPGNTWDGTIISQDGVHPSGGETQDFDETESEDLWLCAAQLGQFPDGAARSIFTCCIRSRISQQTPAPLCLPTQTRARRQRCGRRRCEESRGDLAWKAVCSPRILAPGVADAYSMRTFAQFDGWRELAGDARAYEVFRYLADTHTGLFHMNVVAEGEDGLSEFVQIRDPVKIINVYGYAYCGILGPTMAGVCEGIGLGRARTLVLPAWNHVAAEAFYDDHWHYLDLDVRAVFRRDNGTLASLDEARQDGSLWRERGPLFFPNDSLASTREIYQKTEVQTYHGFQQTGHTMDYVLRPGERFTRWWRPQGDRWHHIAQYNEQPWLCKLLESPPRGPKPNHRHFSVHNHGNGRFVYEPKLTDEYSDFVHGVYVRSNVVVTDDGLTLERDGTGAVEFEVRSPYVIVPQVGQLDRIDDDRQASVIELSGRHVTLSISLDNGLTWSPVPTAASESLQAGGSEAEMAIDLTPWVSGRYSYLLRFTLDGRAGDALLSRLKMTTWVQVAPASLPALTAGAQSNEVSDR